MFVWRGWIANNFINTGGFVFLKIGFMLESQLEEEEEEDRVWIYNSVTVFWSIRRAEA